MQHLPIDYIEFYSPRLEHSQRFLEQSCGWSFVDYGDDYRDIRFAGLGAGMTRMPQRAPLIVLKAEDLVAAREQIKAAGAEITQDIFDFPGGQRFEFREPGGTLMAVWAELKESRP